MHKSTADSVETGDDLYTIYAETASKRAAAAEFAKDREPIRVRTKTDALVEQR